MSNIVKKVARPLYTWLRKKLLAATDIGHRDKSNTIYSAAEFVVLIRWRGII